MEPENSNNISNDECNDDSINIDYEHSRSIFEEVLCTVSIDDVEENIFKEEMPKLKSTCLSVFAKIRELLITSNTENITTLEIKNLLQVYTNLLNLGHIAVRYVKDKELFENVSSLPLTISEIILVTFTHCKESDKIYGSHFELLSELLSTIFKKAGELQNSLVNLINKLLIYDLANASQIEFLVEEAHILSCIGEIVFSLDTKTAVEIWRAYVALTNKYCAEIKDYLDVTSPLKYLSSKIIQDLQTAITTEDMKAAEKVLKVSYFYLKTLIKLCELYIDSVGDAHYHLLELLILLNQYSSPYLKWEKFQDELINCIQMYLVTGADPLLNILFEDRAFVQCYFKNIFEQIKKDDRRLGAIFLSTSIIKKTICKESEIHSMWFSTDLDFNIISVIFSSIDFSHVELSSEIPVVIPTLLGAPPRIGSLYEYILINAGAAIINLKENHSKIVQEFMLKNLLQPNAWKALLTVDLWCIVARYANEDFCYNQVLFLLEIFLDLKAYRHKLEVTFLCNLIGRLYKLLSANNILNLASKFPCIDHRHIWIVIGLNNHPDADIIHTVYNSTLLAIDSFFKKNEDIEEYNKMCDLLELLSTETFSKITKDNLKKILSKIVLLWSLNFEKEILQKNWLTDFINIISKITCTLITHMSNADIKKILHSISKLHSTNISIKLSIVQILKALGSKYMENTSEQRNIFDIIKSLFKVLLKDENSLVKQEALEAFSFFGYNTQHKSIISDTAENDECVRQICSNYVQKIVHIESQKEFLKIQRNDLFDHKCLLTIDTIEPQQKKQKTSHNVDISTLIQKLKLNCNSLAEYCVSDELTYEDKADLLSTVTKLIPLLEK